MPANTPEHAQPERDAVGRWRKGTASPNPTGRPKVVAEVRDLARRHTRTCVARLLTLVRSGKSEVARAAACDLLAYGWGRPTQAILAAVADLTPVDVDALRATLAQRVIALGVRALPTAGSAQGGNGAAAQGESGEAVVEVTPAGNIGPVNGSGEGR